MVSWYREYYVWLVIFFPLTAVIGSVFTIFFAIKSNDGLVVDDYYKEGLKINRTLERDQITVEHEINAYIDIKKISNEIVISLVGNSKFTLPKQIQVSILNATRSGLDKKFSLILDKEKNMYIGYLPILPYGKWYIHIETNKWRIIKQLDI